MKRSSVFVAVVFGAIALASHPDTVSDCSASTTEDSINRLRRAGDTAQRTDPKAAVDFYERALRLKPSDIGTRSELAKVLFFSRLPARALVETERILAVEPNHLPALTVTAEIHMLTQYEFLDFSRAVALLRTALSVSESSPKSYADTCFLLGRAMARAGRFCESLDVLPTCPPSQTYGNERLRLLALSNLRIGNLDEAVRWATQALQNDPRDATAFLLLNHVLDLAGTDALGVRARLQTSKKKVRAPVKFKEIGQQAGTNLLDGGKGGSFGDYNRDGYPDLAFGGPYEAVHLLRNNRNGTFSDVTGDAGLGDVAPGWTVLFADVENDGFQDLFITRNSWFGAASDSLLRNNGDGTFTDVSEASGLTTVSTRSFAASFGDCDNDGLLDLMVANMYLDDETPGGPTLWRNRGDGTFEDFTQRAHVQHAGSDLGCSWGDYDLDGNLDLFVVSQYQTHHLYRNRGDCTFDDVTLEVGITRPTTGYMSFFFDHDQDADLDLFVSNYTESDSALAYSVMNQKAPSPAFAPALYRNDGNGKFTDITLGSGLDMAFGSMAANFADLDSDGLPEILLGNGGPPLTRVENAALFFNKGNGHYVEASKESGFVASLKSHSLTVADIDLDGDLDVAVSMGGAYQGDLMPNLLFENQGTDNHWLALWLEGSDSNRDGIGARISVKTSTGTQLHQVSGGAGFGITQYPPLVIGLGASEQAEEVHVVWPSGREQRFSAVAADQRLIVRESSEEMTEFRPERKAIAGSRGFYVSRQSIGERPSGLTSTPCSKGDDAPTD